MLQQQTEREGGKEREREKEGLEALNVMNGREYTRLIHQGCTISVTTATEKKERGFSILYAYVFVFEYIDT